jgi:glycosyltransferase involved in cell wall biosynthesis
MKQVTLIIPAKNEQDSLPTVLRELKKFNVKIIIVIDNTDIKTQKAISNFNCKIIKQKSKGYGAAIIEGIKYVQTKYLCIFNADGSFQPKDIKKMLVRINKNNDFVFASRYLKNGGSEDDTFITYIGNKIFTILGKIFFKINISDILFTFIIGNADKFRKLDLSSNDFRLCVEIPYKIKINKFTYTSIASFERKRIAGTKKVNEIKDGFLILFSMISLYIKK